MIFLTSLAFAILFWAVEPVLMTIAKLIPRVSYFLALTGLNAAFYFILLLAMRAGRRLYEDFRVGEKQLQEVCLRDWLEVNRCRWLNVLGLLGISGGAALVFLTGRLPFPFWFLYAAIIVGLLDVIKKTRLIAVKSTFPTPRFDMDATTPFPEHQWRQVEFRWRPWPEGGAPAEDYTAVFTIDSEAYQQARNLPRLPTDRLENYLRYVRDEFTHSVQQVATHFRRQSEEKGFSVLQEVANIVCFTRSISYASDEDTRGVVEYANYPIETLSDKAGDCEDHAILAACLLFYLGHDVGLFFLKFAECSHAALGYNTRELAGPFSTKASNGNKYYYVETVPTSELEQIGGISIGFLLRMQDAQVIPVE